jgi:hypothetical protein
VVTSITHEAFQVIARTTGKRAKLYSAPRIVLPGTGDAETPVAAAFVGGEGMMR